MTNKQIKKILETPFWPQELEPNVNYQRLHDDHDGEYVGIVNVLFDPMGDAYLMVDKAYQSLRFRTWEGGGMSLRVRNALLILAMAIKMDNEDRPQQIPNKPIC